MRLVAAGVAVRRGGRSVLDGVGLEVATGSFVAVIGANGAGKSTLLAVLAGLLKPDAGAVTVDGIAIGAIPPRVLARRRAYLPQAPRAEWPLSVERMVALGLLPRLPAFGPLPANAHLAVDAALQDADLIDRREQAVTTLSGGEQARAMFARAVVGAPDLLIMDEPTAGLDPAHALHAVRELRRQAEQGRIVIAAMHDLTSAARHATRILVLAAGRVIADGAPGTVLTAPLMAAAFGISAAILATPGGLTIDVTG